MNVCKTCNGRGWVQAGYAGEQLERCTDCNAAPCGTCHGEGVIDSGGVTPWGAAIEIPCPECERARFMDYAAIGAAWHKDSSLQKWFPFTFEELRAVVDAIDRYISAAGYNEHTIILTKARADIVNSNFGLTP